jgi:hypothetical protein
VPLPDIFEVLEEELPPPWHPQLRSLKLRIGQRPDKRVSDLVREAFFYEPRRNKQLSPFFNARETRGVPLPEYLGMDPEVPEAIAKRVWERLISNSSIVGPRNMSAIVKQGLGL